METHNLISADQARENQRCKCNPKNTYDEKEINDLFNQITDSIELVTANEKKEYASWHIDLGYLDSPFYEPFLHRLVSAGYFVKAPTNKGHLSICWNRKPGLDRTPDYSDEDSSLEMVHEKLDNLACRLNHTEKFCRLGFVAATVGVVFILVEKLLARN